ncbi:AAA family ATPase [Pseudactinotalea sp.]|uniref:AAA family ATPase n=1 Tax=Pseudactinotalea sp. TaxID=1926260 RepID=UPI003B3B31EB
MLTTLAVSGYRSLRDVVVELGQITVVTGANGSGKSSLYRALRLLTDAARGEAVSALAREGGLPSTLWAGPETISGAMRRGEVPVQGTRRSGPVRLQIGFASDGLGYAMDLGLPKRDMPTRFELDPEIKAEHVWSGPVPRPAALLAQRHGAVATTRTDEGWDELTLSLPTYSSMLAELADPTRAPELLTLREQMRGWRFYDHLRTDAHAPARAASVGTRTPVLGGDGADLAAAIATIIEIGRADTLAEAVSRAFEGSRLQIEVENGRFTLLLQQPGMLRPLRADELSDGTLRYLLLAAALLSPRPPELFVLNEPETSLHPDLLAPLAEMVRAAAERTQIVLVTHSAPLAAALGDDVTRVELVKELGETQVAEQGLLTRPSWSWPKR